MLRVDLRYPQGFSSEKVSSKQITKFQESFKAMMCAYLKRKTHNRHSKPRFIWCKEYVTSENPHYHVAVLLNGDVFQRMGPYDDVTGEYVSGMIAKAWASATGLSVEQASRAIYFAKSGTCEINKRCDKELYENQYNQAFYRVSYFAKKKVNYLGTEEASITVAIEFTKRKALRYFLSPNPSYSGTPLHWRRPLSLRLDSALW
ncbi:inovirus-type Gp2 protein [Vibrio harveyi]|nr:inovirus-type Gp2 protein [Vibrio harveyi]